MDAYIAPSARRHGIADDDIRHAYDHAMRALISDDDLPMIIGADRAGNLIEVGYRIAEADELVVIVHAQPARSKYLW